MPRRAFRPLLLLLPLAAGALLYALGALLGPAGPDVLGGAPVASAWSPATWARSLGNRCYSVGYSEWRGLPLWAAYRLKPVARHQRYARPRFETDARTWRRVAHGDYSRSGYDRGHLAPSHAIAQLCGQTAQAETFLLSNIAPQRPRLNQKLWQRLEEVELDHFARRLGEIQVLTGPVFGATPAVLASGLPVPEAYYKIYYQPASRSRPARTLAFLVPQEVRGTEPLDRYVVSIDAVEAATGLDFLALLPGVDQDRLEAAGTADPAWGLAEVARRPPRY